jgi:hypothetical protein
MARLGQAFDALAGASRAAVWTCESRSPTRGLGARGTGARRCREGLRSEKKPRKANESQGVLRFLSYDAGLRRQNYGVRSRITAACLRMLTHVDIATACDGGRRLAPCAGRMTKRAEPLSMLTNADVLQKFSAACAWRATVAGALAYR